MKIALLFLSLLLPWATTFVGLSALERRLGVKYNLARQLGFSYFISLFALYISFMASRQLAGELVVFPVLAFFALSLLALLALAHRLRHHSMDASGVTPLGSGQPLRRERLFWLLLGLVLVHLGIVVLEAAYRPIFPWDAWQTWMYRAKTWFMYREIIPFSSPSAWRETGEIVFNTPGHDYPIFVSVLGLWAALNLGQWSDTLVNLPVIFCGPALCLALFGLCREAGWSQTLAIGTTLLLISTPLLGTHLSLAGQADIWMVGFSGLGLASLLMGLNKSSRYHVALGLMLCFLSVFVKNEGIVWFTAALAIVILFHISIRWIAAICLIAVLVAIGFYTTEQVFTIPFLGALGYENSILHLPWLGSVPISEYNVLDDYLDHLFLKGSWNILWYLTGGAVVYIVLVREATGRKLTLAFIGVVLFIQFVIFGFTEHGRWAEDGTALNRLLLHVLPALLFCLALICHQLYERASVENGARHLRSVLVCGGTSLFIVLALVAAFLQLSLPSNQGSSFDLTSRLFAVTGRAQSTTEGIEVTSYKGGIAILTSGTVHIDSEEISILAVELGGTIDRPAGFFWRQEETSDDVESITIGTAGEHLIDLSTNPAWNGTISEVGLILYETERLPHSSTNQFKLLPKSTITGMQEIWSDWSSLEQWAQASVNWLAGGTRDQRLPLALFLTIWLFLAVSIVLIAYRKQLGYAVPLLCLLAWLTYDIKWATNSARQLSETINFYADSATQSLDFPIDIRLGEAAVETMSHLPAEPQRLIIASASSNQRFKVLRAKYWLLPHPAQAIESDIGAVANINTDAVVYYDAFFRGPGEEPAKLDELEVAVKNILGPEFSSKEIPNSHGYIFTSQAAALFN